MVRNLVDNSIFRSSKHLLLEDSCSQLELRETHLHADCKKVDGCIQHSHIDLNECIGFIDGRLEWDLKGFKDHCFEYTLEDFFLVCKYYHPEGKYQHEGKKYHTCRLDLRSRICNLDGILILIELNRKLSIMLSEVPWMKFKVIAEPDLSIFARDAVMKETLEYIAETTVKHVTTEMHERLTIAMEIAIKLVTESAMSHVHCKLEELVKETVGCATARASITAAECLHLYGPPRHVYGGAYVHGEGAYGYGEGKVYGEGEGGAYGYGGGKQVYGEREGDYGKRAPVYGEGYGGNAPVYGDGPPAQGYEAGRVGYSNGQHHEEHRVYTDNQRYAETAKYTEAA